MFGYKNFIRDYGLSCTTGQFCGHVVFPLHGKLKEMHVWYICPIAVSLASHPYFSRGMACPSSGQWQSESTVVLSIIIGIAMVFCVTFGPMQKLKFPFSLSYSTQFHFYQHQSEEHVES